MLFHGQLRFCFFFFYGMSVAPEDGSYDEEVERQKALKQQILARYPHWPEDGFRDEEDHIPSDFVDSIIDWILGEDVNQEETEPCLWTPCLWVRAFQPVAYFRP